MKKLLCISIGLLIISGFFFHAFGDEKSPKNFILFFQMAEYDLRIPDAISYFFHDMCGEYDNLLLLTPLKSYRFVAEKMRDKSKEELIKTVTFLIRKDIQQYASEYKAVYDAMMNTVKEITYSLKKGDTILDIKLAFQQYRQYMINIKNLRRLNEDLFDGLAKMYKGQNIPTSMFLVYQKEFRPVPSREVLEKLSSNLDLKARAFELFQQETFLKKFDADRTARKLLDSSIRLFFIYMDKTTESIMDIEMREYSNLMFGILSKIVDETGGGKEMTSNLEPAFRKFMENP